MKKIVFFIIICTFFVSNSFAQRTEWAYRPTFKHIFVSGGIVPDSDFEAFKGMIMVNNIVKKRLGAYYSYENGKHNYREHILGGTFGINQYAFVYAGLGIDRNQDYDDARYGQGDLRKEAGVGFTPYKFTAATIGWSRGVGMTFTVGFNIPIKDQRNKRYTVPR